MLNQVASGQAFLLGAYAASNPAESFVVASEVFFKQARPTADAHPDLYRELSRYCRLDPLAWS